MALTMSLLPPALPLPPLPSSLPPSSQTCTWGMGQHPHEPSGILQHVEELGHSNCLSGHWTAPKGLVSVDGMTQDSTPSVKVIPPTTRGAAGTRACRPSHRRTRGLALGLRAPPGFPNPLSPKPVLAPAIWHRAEASTDWVGLKPGQLGLSPPTQCLAVGLSLTFSPDPSSPPRCPSLQSRGAA